MDKLAPRPKRIKTLDDFVITRKRICTDIPADCWSLVLRELSSYSLVTFSQMSKKHRELVFCARNIWLLNFIVRRGKSAVRPSFFDNIQVLAISTKLAVRYGVPSGIVRLQFTHSGKAKDIPDFNAMTHLQMLIVRSANYPAKRIHLPEGLQRLDIKVGRTESLLGLPKTLDVLVLRNMNMQDRLCKAEEICNHERLRTLCLLNPTHTPYFSAFIPPNLINLELNGDVWASTELSTIPPTVQVLYLAIPSFHASTFPGTLLYSTIPNTLKEVRVLFMHDKDPHEHYEHLLESISFRWSIYYYFGDWQTDPYYAKKK